MRWTSALGCGGAVIAAYFAFFAGSDGGLAPAAWAQLGEDEAEESAPAAEESPPADEGSEAPPPEADAGASEALPETRASPIDEFFNGMSKDDARKKAEQFFAENAVLEDPFGRFEGREAIAAHYEKLYEGIKSSAFEVREEFVSGEETVALWTMTLTHSSLRGGETITVDGVTHVRFQGDKAVALRDYYDLGGLVYENVPIIGRLVRWVKGKVD